MAMVRCDANEHHYDNSKHSSCPHCISGRGNDDKTSMRPKSRPQPDRSGSEDDTFIKKPDGGGKTSPKDNGPKTVAPWQRKKKDESSQELKSAYDLAPIVGWIVIVEGLQKGRDFRIIPGINKIGRGNTNTINIDNGDSEIAREGHCLIEYDLKSGQFYLERGATSTYHNDGRVGGNGNELVLGDTIQIGSTTLKFIPFCTSDFCWEM